MVPQVPHVLPANPTPSTDAAAMKQALGLAKVLAADPQASTSATINAIATQREARTVEHYARLISIATDLPEDHPGTLKLAADLVSLDATVQKMHDRAEAVLTAVRADASAKYAQARADHAALDLAPLMNPAVIASETRTASDADLCPSCGGAMVQAPGGYVKKVRGEWIRVPHSEATHEAVGHTCSKDCGHEDMDYIAREDWREFRGEF